MYGEYDESTIAKKRLCRINSMIEYRRHRIQEPGDAAESTIGHAKAEVAALEYLIDKTKAWLNQAGINYEDYENYGKDLIAKREQDSKA